MTKKEEEKKHFYCPRYCFLNIHTRATSTVRTGPILFAMLLNAQRLHQTPNAYTSSVHRPNINSLNQKRQVTTALSPNMNRSTNGSRFTATFDKKLFQLLKKKKKRRRRVCAMCECAYGNTTQPFQDLTHNFLYILESVTRTRQLIPLQHTTKNTSKTTLP